MPGIQDGLNVGVGKRLEVPKARSPQRVRAREARHF